MFLRLTFASLVVALPLRPVQAQAPAEQSLRPANARLGFEFDRIVGLRELPDGRVLVADAGQKVLVVADFAANRAVQIGRGGKGPGEYAAASPLYSLGPDSTIMSDRGNGRWLVLAGDRIAGTTPPDDPATRASGAGLRGADERGMVLAGTPPAVRNGTRNLGKGDSTALLLVGRASGDVDTIAKVRVPPITMQAQVDKSGKITSLSIRRVPLAVGEEPVLFPDGWLAVARLEPYRIDWRAPDGRWIRGAPLPFEARPVDGRERQAYLDRQANATGVERSAPADDAWPEVMPPFQPRALVALPNGDLLILRTPTADHPGNRYDRVDRRGRLVGWLELPPTERLVGVGAHGAYVVLTDGDGLQHLQRRPWP